MGLGTTKKRTVVGTAAMHLAGVDNDPTGDTIVYSVLFNQDIPANLLRNSVIGMGVTIRPAYAYAKSDYTLKLPSGHITGSPQINTITVEQVIARDTGNPHGVKVLFTYMNVMTPGMSVLPVLVKERKLNINSGTVGVLPGYVVPPTACAEYPEHGSNCLVWESFKIAGIYPTKFTQLANAQVRVDYTIMLDVITHGRVQGNAFDSFSETLTSPYPAATMGQQYIYATYVDLDAAGNMGTLLHSWLYKISTNKYPELSGNSIYLPKDTFLPVIPIRYKNRDLTSDKYKNTDLYKTSKILMHKMKMSFLSTGEKLNDNPSVGDMDNAYVMFGIDLQTKDPDSLWYFGSFLYHLFQNQQQDKNAFFGSIGQSGAVSYAGNQYTSGGGYTSLNEKKLKLRIFWDYISAQNINKHIGKVGFATKKFGDHRIPNPHYDPDPPEIKDGVYANTGPQYVEQAYITIEMQITKRIVRRITCYGMTLINDVHKGYTVDTDLWNVWEESDNHNFVVPVMYNLAMEMPLRRRNAMYTDASMLIINSYDKVKVKWYQSGWFMMVVVAVIMVVMVLTNQYWMSKFIAIFSSWSAFFIFMMQAVLVSIAVKVVSDWVIDQIGVEWGLAIAVIIAIAAMMYGDSSNILAFTGTQASMTTSQAAMMISSSLISSSNDFIQESAEEDLNEYQAFEEKMEDRWEELKVVEELLENKSMIDPIKFTQATRLRMVPNESPTNFFNRTLEYPTYSTTFIHDEIPHFTDIKRRLPNGVSADLYNLNLL